MSEYTAKQLEALKQQAISTDLVEHIYTADPSAHVFDGRIYIYPSHDIEAGIPFNDNGDHFGMQDYHVLSLDSPDSPAVDHGVALHIKDVKSPLADKPDPKAYKFVELGQGNVDLPAVFKALEKVKFNRWAVVELDGVPEPNRTPLESATISKAYLNDKLKQKI